MLDNVALPLDLGTLATRTHMSRRTLSRRFREETGVSPIPWLADARIDRAREILETTSEPVENIGRLTRRAGICSSGLPSADRHLTEGVPRRLARIINSKDPDGDGSSLARKIMTPRDGRRSPAPTQGEEPIRDPPSGGMNAAAGLAGGSKVCWNCGNLCPLAGRPSVQACAIRALWSRFALSNEV
jgi:AraC-like DNA-binding protein